MFQTLNQVFLWSGAYILICEQGVHAPPNRSGVNAFIHSIISLFTKTQPLWRLKGSIWALAILFFMEKEVWRSARYDYYAICRTNFRRNLKQRYLIIWFWILEELRYLSRKMFLFVQMTKLLEATIIINETT